MGLFINNDNHPTIFKNKENIIGTNQSSYKQNAYSELIKEQKQANESVIKSLEYFGKLYQQQTNEQVSRWEDVENQIGELKESRIHQEKFKDKVSEWFASIDEKNIQLQEIIENDKLSKQEVMEQLDRLNHSNRQIENKMNNFGENALEIDFRLKELVKQNQFLTEQIAEQSEKQNLMLDRLENQEALLEKATRQIDHIRSILYERASFLAEKIENGYNLTSSYFYKLLTGSDQPLNLYMMRKKNEESKK